MTTGILDILKILLGYPWRVGLGIACLLAVDAGQLVIPLITQRVIDAAAGGTATAGFLSTQALLVVALAIGITFFRFAWRHFFFSAARLAELALRQRIYEHAQALPVEAFARTRTGEIMAIATNDVESVRQALAMGVVAGFDASLYAVVAVVAIFLLDSAIAFWVILPLPLLGILMKVTLKTVYDRWDRVQAAFETMTERTRESIAGIRVTKAFGRADDDASRFEATSREVFARTLRYVKVDALFSPSILLLTGSCTAILLWLGGARVISGQMSVGTLVALSAYLGMLTWPMIAAGWMFALLQRSAASLDRIRKFLARPAQPELPGAAEIPVREGRIDLRDLTFAYPGVDAPALADLALDVPAGSSLGIVGEIGSGKTTLIQLLLRLHEPPVGTVFIDGRDVRLTRQPALREGIAWVPQEAFLFSDTVAANLRLGNPAATSEELATACRLAALDEEIRRLEKGYETLLGERGITLSGGQKQRLALARALLKPAPILILDDTLSAVDAETERRILAAIEQVRRRQTTLVISHRVSAVRALEQIIVLRAGRIIQRGTHAALAASEGPYRELCELQALEGEG